MVDDKRTACIQQMWLLGAICKVSNGRTFNVCYWYLVFSSVVQVTNCWLAHSQLSWKVKLFSCNLIGQLCLSGPGYNSRTVTWRIHQCDYYWAACAPSHKMGFRSSAAKNGLPGEGRHEGLVPRNDVLTSGFIWFSLARTLARILFVPRLRSPWKTHKALRTWRRLFALFEAIRPWE